MIKIIYQDKLHYILLVFGVLYCVYFIYFVVKGNCIFSITLAIVPVIVWVRYSFIKKSSIKCKVIIIIII